MKKSKFNEIVSLILATGYKKIYYKYEWHVDSTGAICTNLFDFKLFQLSNIGYVTKCISYPLSFSNCRVLIELAKKHSCISL